MGITEPAVDRYLEDLLPERDAVLQEMEALARERRIPIIGPVVGRFVYQLIRLVKARNIFEMGSAIGYSTIWMARAAGEGATVYYTDSDPANARLARGFFERADVVERIRILEGDALELLQRTPGTFDVIFNDVDKKDYPQVFPLAVPRIRSGGLFLADNVLWRGQVAGPPPDETTRAIAEFNRLLYSSPDLFPSILPLRDGFAVCEKR